VGVGGNAAVYSDGWLTFVRGGVFKFVLQKGEKEKERERKKERKEGRTKERKKERERERKKERKKEKRKTFKVQIGSLPPVTL